MVRPTLSVVPEQSSCIGASGLEAPEQGRQAQLGLSANERRAVATEVFRREALGKGTLVTEAEWTLRAVCAGADPDALFVTGAAQRDAAKLCQACPVRLECLADALDNQIEYGVWGGMTERQRRAVLKKSPEVVSWRSVLEEARSSSTQEAAS